ncbi:MAG: redoxin family protein [Verrucomicrobiota bacterium]
MKSIALFAATSIAAAAFATAKPAPDFSVRNTAGETVSLADLKGKTVVLEWVNFDCPFVKKHYESGNMAKLQEKYTGKGVVWLTVSSAAEKGKNHVAPDALAARAKKEGNKATHILVDGDGKMGKAYDAKVTPHMFVIDSKGELAYDGAIDSKATPDAADVATADPLFANALDAVLAGKEVVNAKNKPYGCGVKY